MKFLNFNSSDYILITFTANTVLFLTLLVISIPIRSMSKGKTFKTSASIIQICSIAFPLFSLAYLLIPVLSGSEALFNVAALFVMYHLISRNLEGSKLDPFVSGSIIPLSVFFIYSVTVNAQFLPTVKLVYSFIPLVIVVCLVYRLVVSKPVIAINTTSILLISMPALTLFSTYPVIQLFKGKGGLNPLFWIIPLTFSHILLLYGLQLFRKKDHAIKKSNDEHQSTLDFFNTIGEIMKHNHELKEISNSILAFIMNKTNAERGALFLFNQSQKTLSAYAHSGNFIVPSESLSKGLSESESLTLDFDPEMSLPEDSLLFKQYKKNESLHITNIFEHKYDPVLRYNTKNDELFISSLIAIPILVNGNCVGLVAVQNNHLGLVFDETDFKTAQSLTLYAEVMLSNFYNNEEILKKRELDRDIELSTRIQKALLPLSAPHSQGYALAVHSKPARMISGDYHDFIKLDSDKTAILICDVSGKGVAAGLVMSVIRTTVHLLHNFSKQSWRNHSSLRLVNQAIADIGAGYFATAFFATYNHSTRVFEYANAAHMPAALFRASTNSIEFLDTEGLPLGVEAESKYQSSTTTLNKGDLLFLYTDGMSEAMNNMREEFGKERLLSLIQENLSLEVKEIKSLISNAIKNHQSADSEQHDDQTCILMKVS